MGIFDILQNGNLKEEMRSLAAQAGAQLRGLQAQAPSGMGGLFGAGALGAMLGSMMPKGAAQAAGLLGVGAIAWNFYKKWQQGGSPFAQNAEGSPFAQQSAGASFGERAQTTPFAAANTQLANRPKALDPTALLLLRTMIYAARADGHVDADEQMRIKKLLPELFPEIDVTPYLHALLEEPLDLNAIVAMVANGEQAEDIYRLTCIIMDPDHFLERSYLTELANALGLSRERVVQLEGEAQKARIVMRSN